MKEIAWSDLRRLNSGELKKLMPVRVVLDGSPFGVFADPAKVVVTEDLSPVMASRIRGVEMIARQGMPKEVKVFAQDIIEARTIKNQGYATS